MKFRTTEKEIKTSFAKGCVIRVGYCQLNSLLKYEDPIAYTCGVYGWNCDIFQIGGVALSYGYRPFGKSVPYVLVKEYEKKAERLLADKRVKKYETRTRKLHELFFEFAQKAIS